MAGPHCECELIPVKSISTGAALPAIIPIIITTHMAKMKARSAGVQAVSAAMPMAAMATSSAI